MMAGFPGGAGLEQFLKLQQVKSKIFVSYHHGGDRAYYEAFSRIFAAAYDLIQDNSVSRALDSDDSDYVIRAIRENYIKGSSCTVVLVGRQTSGRKFVDWEIKATLDQEHALIGLQLPSAPLDPYGKVIVPGRLYDNISSGYALWLDWAYIIANAPQLPGLIAQARTRSRALIVNSRARLFRNASA